MFSSSLKTFAMGDKFYLHNIFVLLLLLMAIYLRYFLFAIVMATIPTTSQITTSTDEDNRTDSETI